MVFRPNILFGEKFRKKFGKRVTWEAARGEVDKMGVRGLTAVLEKCPQAWDVLTIKPPVPCPLCSAFFVAFPGLRPDR